MSEKKIDEIDKIILRTLQEDARTSFKAIAHRCDVSMETIKNRFEQMKNHGVIRGTTIVINPQAIGQKHIVMVGIQIRQPYSEQILAMVKKIPGVYVVTRSLGRYDIEAIAVLKNIEEIGSMKNTIEDLQQVRHVDVDILVDKPLLCPKNFEFA